MDSKGSPGRGVVLDSTAVGSLSPPLPPPKDVVQPPSTSINAPSATSPTRIRRKPLPSTALTLSPQSLVSSPHSLYSYHEDEARSARAIASGAVLNDILDSPQPQIDPKQTFYTETTPTSERFPFPPGVQGSELSSAGRINADPSQSPVEDYLRVDGIPLGTDIRVKEAANMAPKGNERPPPLRVESIKAVKAMDAKKPQSPGSVFTSFFGRRQNSSPKPIASPSEESGTTEISEGRSPLPSSYPGSVDGNSSYFAQPPQFITNGSRHASPQSSQDSTMMRSASIPVVTDDLTARCNVLEAELQDISKELAGSIRRELDLEDLVDRLQSQHPAPMSADRTSDYFSDSGTSSSRHHDSMTPKEEMDKIRRESEQQRAQLRMELSEKWQAEVAQRKLLESHVTLLEGKLQQTRRDTSDNSDSSTRIRELEAALDDSRRRLNEERKTKENFEDLLKALKVDLERHRNERDNLRDEVVPQLKSQIEGLESSFTDTQKQPYDFARMQQEIKHLRDENAALASARGMNQDLIRGFGQYGVDDDLSGVRSSLYLPKTGGLGRSNTAAGRGSTRNSLARSGSLSRTNSILNRPLPDMPDAVTDKLNAVEQQRDALQSTAKHLRDRLNMQVRKYEKQIAQLRAELNKANDSTDDRSDPGRRGGYEREVRGLRQEINLLRRRADDALDQKWQCEKGLSGLKMDLDRSRQETTSLQNLLQARDSEDPEQLSDALQRAIDDLQKLHNQSQESMSSLAAEQKLAHQLEESAKRSELLSAQVRMQLQANSALRQRLMGAVESGEKNQLTSANQINSLQSKLKKLEDTITSAQMQSETAVMKHEEDISNLKAAHNAQLQRAKAGIRSPISNHPSNAKSPLSPLFANSKRSPRLDQTSTGPGQSLNQLLKTEFLEKKVGELEKALRDAESGMEEVVSRMNQAQIGVFELQQERDEALKRTKKLEADVKAERERFQMLITGGVGI